MVLWNQAQARGELIAQVCELTGAQPHGTSPDGKFTVATVECQGACANAPMFDLDGVYHEDLTAEKVVKILGGVK
jgi:NADH:ubiquinone oxidoreductase subunit E